MLRASIPSGIKEILHALVLKRFITKPAVTADIVEKFNKKVGKIQKEFGIKGTSKFLSLEREKWHLRQKQRDEKDHKTSVNKEFRNINPDRDITSFIEANKLGRRKPERVKKETRIIKYRKEYIPKLKFCGAATKRTSFLPEDENMQEVAFVGRSNVGKSTLINSFTSSGVARTSDTPGETKSINWYQWANKMFIVDLPGYGFSYSSVEQKQAWVDLMRDYVTNRKTLRRVMVLLDARHGIKPSDLDMIELLNTGKKKFQILLTKVDQVIPSDLARRCTLVSKYVVGPVMMVSAKRNMGMDKLRAEVERFMRRKPANSDESSKPKKRTQPDRGSGQTTKTEKGATTTGEVQQPKKEGQTTSIKSLWRKDEERKKEMLERKMKEERRKEKEEMTRPVLDRDERGRVFKPSQRYKSVMKKKT